MRNMRKPKRPKRPPKQTGALTPGEMKAIRALLSETSGDRDRLAKSLTQLLRYALSLGNKEIAVDIAHLSFCGYRKLQNG